MAKTSNVASVEGVLPRVLIENTIQGSKQDHLDLWDVTQIALTNHQSDITSAQATITSLLARVAALEAKAGI